ncbi:FAD/NAD-binding domain-containing protein [Lyophyllum atratum]|nr:FAD/NAD-binding domain-containing protein [Lyophyllum atratum]
MSSPPVNGVNNLDGHGTNAYELPTFSIDEARPMRVVAIGAGYSGITAGIRFRQRVKNVDITVYESNAGVGGAWFANRYPGLACDIPSHAYQLTFENNTNWSAFYAPGPEIRAYLDHVVDKYKLRPFIKLRHRITGAKYDEGTGKWHLKVRRPLPGSATEQGDHIVWDWKTDFEEFDDIADVVLAGLGPLSRWSWPDIEALESFEGEVLHSAQWEMGENGKGGWQDTVKDWGDKRVGVIGVGSSAIQIVPALQSRVKHVTNYVRGRTWLSAPFVRDRLLSLAGGEEVSNYVFTEEDKKKFQDPAYYKDFRWQLECELNGANPATLRGTPLQEGAKIVFREDMMKKLAKKPWIADHLIPDFAPCCRRLTPGPGYLEALCADNVDFVPTDITRITPTGIDTGDGKHQDLDIIICATGFDTSFLFDFPILGRGGEDLSKRFDPHPRTYLSVATDGFPNWFQCLGPNAAVGAGSLLLVCERQVDYAVAATLKLQREHLKSIDVKPEAVNDFDAYLESYFPSTVYSEKCRSWYKGGKVEGRVMALWPGSALHAARALTHPRWEDFNYELLDGPVKNRFYWFGDGQTIDDKDPNGDKAWYLKEVDYPPVPA